MILEFLLVEIESERFKDRILKELKVLSTDLNLVTNVNLADEQVNEIRRALFEKYRKVIIRASSSYCFCNE